MDGGAAWENKLLLLVILVCVDDLDVIRALDCRGRQAYPTSTALPLSCSLILGQAMDFCRGMEKFTEWGFVRKPSARPQTLRAVTIGAVEDLHLVTGAGAWSKTTGVGDGHLEDAAAGRAGGLRAPLVLVALNLVPDLPLLF